METLHQVQVPAENNLRSPSGIVKAKDFIEWLSKFMLLGSNQKEIICDHSSFIAIHRRAGLCENGIRMLGKGLLFTPFGRAKITESHTNGIVVMDRGVSQCDLDFQPVLAAAFASADTILEIVGDEEGRTLEDFNDSHPKELREKNGLP